MQKSSNYTWKLGMFVLTGMALFTVTIYFIGKSKNLFGSNFNLQSHFKNVSGLKIGNNVQFSGITVGTVKNIEFLSDSLVVVNLIVKEEVRKFIKIDAIASIGSDGLMGDKVLTISPGTSSNKIISNNGIIASAKTVALEDLMKGLKKSIDNAQIITLQLAEFSYKINKGKGALNTVLTDEKFADGIRNTLSNLEATTTEFHVFSTTLNDKNGNLYQWMHNPEYARSIEKSLFNIEKSTEEFSIFSKKLNSNKGILGKLVTSERLASSLDSSIIHIEKGSKNLLELEEAAKHNFLLRGFFKKKEKTIANKKRMENSKNP